MYSARHAVYVICRVWSKKFFTSSLPVPLPFYISHDKKYSLWRYLKPTGLLETYSCRTFAKYLWNTYEILSQRVKKIKRCCLLCIVAFLYRNHIFLIYLYLYKDWNLLCLNNTLILIAGSCFFKKFKAKQKTITFSGKYFVGLWNYQSLLCL